MLNQSDNEDEEDEKSDDSESSEGELDYHEAISIINVNPKHAPDQEFGNWEKYTKVNFKEILNIFQHEYYYDSY